MVRFPRCRPCGALLGLLLLTLAGCSLGAPTGPQQAGTPAPDQAAGLLAVFATDTPSATPSPTSSPTPTSTPTPLPTPTPVAALSVGSLPVGQVLFSTQRAGEAGEQLWRVSVEDGLAELQSDLLPGAWQCAAGDQVICAFVATDYGLFAAQPVTGTTALLDDLTPLSAMVGAMPISPTLPITAGAALSPTLPITTGAVLSTTLPLTRTDVISPSTPFTPTAPLTSTSTTDLPIDPSTALPTLSFSPDGATLAVATQDRVMIYDLTAPAVLATLDAGGPAELAWSPDGQRLALAYPAGEGNAVALWSLDDGQLRVLAQMEAAGRLAWAPDGSKLAFDARTSPRTPTSQGGQPDVYVLYLRSGEIANLTELFLRNNGVDPAQQIGGWAPQWEADSETVRYVRGVLGQIEEQNIVRHPLRSRAFTVLWPAADEGKLGVVAEPAGPRLARVVLRDGRDMVQVSPVANAWQDATPGAFVDVTVLAWALAGDKDAPRLLLLADRQTLWLLDPATGSLSGLAVACPDCVVTQAVWLP
jgi:hypothetical protein